MIELSDPEWLHARPNAWLRIVMLAMNELFRYRRQPPQDLRTASRHWSPVDRGSSRGLLS
jgi:hypothetical protein